MARRRVRRALVWKRSWRDRARSWQPGDDVESLTRGRTAESPWGFCRTCPFAGTCLGGCSFTARAVRPARGQSFRARDFARRGLRERLVPGAAASGKPLDHGLFEVVEEPLDAPAPAVGSRERLVRITRPARDGA